MPLAPLSHLHEHHDAPVQPAAPGYAEPSNHATLGSADQAVPEGALRLLRRKVEEKRKTRNSAASKVGIFNASVGEVVTSGPIEHTEKVLQPTPTKPNKY